jgi:hypothetical protein
VPEEVFNAKNRRTIITICRRIVQPFTLGSAHGATETATITAIVCFLCVELTTASNGTECQTSRKYEKLTHCRQMIKKNIKMCKNDT